MTFNRYGDCNKRRWFRAARLGGAFLLVLLVTGVSGAGVNTSPITGVTVSPATASVSAGGAVYLRAAVQGTGDFDHRVNWSLTPGNAGTISPTGLFIADPAFAGAAAVKAASVEAPTFSATAAITVAAGGGVLHVDLNNGTPPDGTAFHPYPTIQGAVNNALDGDTIKVAQGIYTENVALPLFGVLLLGGFQGGSAANYAANIPGDFVTRSTDHVNRVTTIQSLSLTTPVVAMLENWDPPNLLTYAVDGFTLTGGSHGVRVSGSGPIIFFISQNLITANGVEVSDASAAGGGINAVGANPVILNNQVSNNRSGWGGGIYINGGVDSVYLVQGNLIEDNRAGSDRAGGVWLTSPGGLFTWNLVRGNRAATLLNYGYGGGLLVLSGQAELNRNVYANNGTPSLGGGIAIEDAAQAVLRHELVFQNTTQDGGAGVYVSGTNTQATLNHCTIAGNSTQGVEGNGVYVWFGGTAQVTNSIIWGNSNNQLYVDPGAALTMTYSDSQNFPGTGNIVVDPLFADPLTDDYHLKSRRGRWNPATSQWVTDAVQSPCIDAGNPLSPFDQEPFHNGARTNMGAYGNTPEASKSLCDPMTGLWYYFLLED
jgi:hypothetical protein